MIPSRRLPFTADPDAQALLGANHTALLIGVVLYQQIPVEKAFAGPALLAARLGTELDASHIAAMDPAALEAAFRERPALHRFPASMAKRTQAVCAHLVTAHGGDPEGLWRNVASADEVMSRLKDMPGFGDYKARIYFGLLCKWFDIRPTGWEKVMPDWPTITDVDAFEDLAELKARKKAWKEAG
ncbi:MAG: HhH-GPD-type base excision DNA repair protein [Acidimicrobiia bacterium]